MNAVPRPYRDEQDLEKMKLLLTLGRQAANGTYYVHPGDLDWWLHYPVVQREWGEIIFLWDGPQPGAPLSGWALLSPEWRAFDVFIDPALRGSARAAQMYAWAEEQAARIVRTNGGADLCTVWVFEEDEILVEHLERRGFQCAESYREYLERPLKGALPTPSLPPGYQIRQVRGEEDGRKRAAASHGAFGSQKPFEAYWSRYRRFMQSPAYSRGLDLMTVAPDGRCASFCICWMDPASRVGLFEPVGAHPDFQGLGLAKAVMMEGMSRMQAGGMSTAAVCAEDENLPAGGLYRSLSFYPVNRIRTYQRDLD